MSEDEPTAEPTADSPRTLTLDAAVRRRRADRAFFLRITRSMQQHHRALELLRP